MSSVEETSLLTSWGWMAAMACVGAMAGAAGMAMSAVGVWAISSGLVGLPFGGWSAKGKALLISGASSGIGAEFARQYAAEGARLVLLARRTDRLEAVASECRTLGSPEVHIVACDVTDQASCRTAVAEAEAHLGTCLDGLVLNAGVSMGVLFEDMREEELDIFGRMMQTNYFGSVWLTYYALPSLKRSTKSPKIVAVTSLAGVMPIPFRTGYAGSKYAVHGFLDTLRQELLITGSNISIHTVCPGSVSTEINESRLGSKDVVLDMTKAMPVDVAVRAMRAAVARGVRTEWMTPSGKFGSWIRFFIPQLADRFTVRAVTSASTVRSGLASKKLK